LQNQEPAIGNKSHYINWQSEEWKQSTGQKKQQQHLLTKAMTAFWENSTKVMTNVDGQGHLELQPSQNLSHLSQMKYFDLL